jgi:hypothetical protein
MDLAVFALFALFAAFAGLVFSHVHEWRHRGLCVA